MANVTQALGYTWSGGQNIPQPAAVSTVGNLSVFYGNTLTAAQANVSINANITQANIKLVYAYATGNATLKTNSASAPTQTLTFVPNNALSWSTGNPANCPITANITTGMFVTNVDAGNTTDFYLAILTS